MAQSMWQELVQDLESRRNATFYVDGLHRNEAMFREREKRYNDVLQVYGGDIMVEYPDGSTREQPLRVENIVQLAADDRSAASASSRMTLRCEPARDSARGASELREKIAHNYLKVNSVYGGLLERFYLDLELLGVNFKLVAPGRNGFPRIIRKDPRYVFPDRRWSPDSPPTSYIVAYEAPLSLVLSEFGKDAVEPLWSAVTGTHDERLRASVCVIEYYDKEESVTAASVNRHLTGNTSQGFREQARRAEIVLDRIPNLVKEVSIVVSALPTPDGDFRGRLDNAIPILNHANRMATYAVDNAEEMVYGQPVLKGIENPEDFGHGVILFGKEDAPETLAQRFQAGSPSAGFFAMSEGLRRAIRGQAQFPEGRSGVPQANVISAAGINALQGGYDGAVAANQRIEAASWEKVLALCFKTDEVFHNERKKILGRDNSERFSTHYTPSEDIKGDYSIEVTYGAAEGVNAFNREIRVIQQFGSGLLDEETAMENLEAVRDVQQVRNRKIRIEARKAVLAMVTQQAIATGNPLPLVKLTKLLRNGENIDEHLDEIAALALPTQQQAPSLPGGAQAPTGAEAFQQAGSIARGGVPPRQENVPGVGTFPGSLADVVGG